VREVGDSGGGCNTESYAAAMTLQIRNV